ncbi:MAG: Ig-like protein, partial [Euryarchaeota archaeon]|nr:Ig-like protein [Euryarchaeota archaeon]
MFRAVHPIKKSPCCKSQQPKPSIFRERSHSTQAEESSLQGEPSPLMQCSLMDLPGRAPMQPKVAACEQQTAGIAEKSASPVVQRYVRVGLYEGSFGLDHIGVGVNSEKTLGFSPKEGLGREAEKGSWVDGEVKEDHGLLDSLTIRTNSRQEARLQASLNRAESSPQKFNLRQHNCSQHGAEILKSAGLNAKSSPFPRAFFEGLKNQY